MKLKEAEQHVTSELMEVYEAAEAANISRLALEHITGWESKEQLFRYNEALTDLQLQKLRELIGRLKDHEPIQYLMNKAWFYGLELFVDNGVLIPRPETEELVDWIVKDVKAAGLRVFEKKATEADLTTQLKIIDVATGSGCIALALKHTMPKAEVWGCDISDAALNVARRNGAQLNIRVDFQSVDFLDPLQQKHLPSVDIIVSNPPYVPKKDKDTMQPNVLRYEPHLALFVDDNDPLLFYKALLQFGTHRLHAGGCFYMEVHEDLAGQVSGLFEEAGYRTQTRLDMQGKPRMVKAMVQS